MPEIEAAELLRLMEYDWPGNVRELANCLERAVILCDGAALTADLLGFGPAPESSTPPELDLSGSLSQVSRRAAASAAVIASPLTTTRVSFAAGVATLPVALAFVLLRPWRWSARAGVLAACVLAAGTRAWASAVAGSVTGGEETPSGGVLGLAHYSLNFLGGLSRSALGGDEVLAPILGAAALALAAPLLVMSFRASTRAGLSDGEAQAAGFFALALVWALVCTAGIAPFRAGFGADQAFAPRYLPFSVVFVVSTVMLAAVFRRVLPSWTKRAIQVVAVVYLVAIALTSPRGWLLAAEHERRIALGAVAATLEIDDPQYALYPNLADGRLPELMALYRAENAAFFRRDWGGWLGAPADEVFALGSDGDCASVSGDESALAISNS